MTTFLISTKITLRGVAANLSDRLVLVGSLGTICWADMSDTEDLESDDFTTLDREYYLALYGLVYGNGLFLAAAEGGHVLTSPDGENWTAVSLGFSANILAVCWAEGLGLFVAVGQGGKILTSPDGAVWTSRTSGSSEDLQGVAENVDQDELMVVGTSGEVLMSSDASSWSSKTSGVSEDLHGVCNDGTNWLIVGKNGTLLHTTDGSSFTAVTVNRDPHMYAIAWNGTRAVLVGEGGFTMVSTDGIAWAQKSSGIDANLFGVAWVGDRFVAVGEAMAVGWSTTGLPEPAMDEFQPISDDYRAGCFTCWNGYLLMGNMLELEDGVWTHHPRRIRNPAPGTVNDFASDGAYAEDLPGAGQILDMEAIEGGIAVAESSKISLITDGGSLDLPWAYNENIGQGLVPISNFTSVNGIGYIVCSDGLIYLVSTGGVSRLESFFDLTAYDDFVPGDEPVQLSYDMATQKLLVFRPESPYLLHLVDDQGGGFTDFNLPSVVYEETTTWSPAAVIAPTGLAAGLMISYIPGDGEGLDSYPIVVQMQLDQPPSGIDTFAYSLTTRWNSELASGEFRLQDFGKTGQIAEVVVRTWCDPDATVRPDVAVMMRQRSDEAWRVGGHTAGTITVDETTCVGEGTAWSRTIAEGDDVTTDFDIPWPVDGISGVYRVTAGPTYTATDYTKIGAKEIRLEDALASGEELYVDPGLCRPFVQDPTGSYIETEEGLHRVTAVNTATSCDLEWYPSQELDGTFVPVQAMPAGDDNGDGKLSFGLGQGFDGLQMRALLIPRSTGDGLGAKLTSLEFGFRPTGKERFRDE